MDYEHDAFWDQTVRTLSLTFEAAHAVQVRRHNERAWLAYHVAGLGRTKKMPSLKKLQVREPLPQRQTWQQQMAVAKQWVMLLGGTVKKAAKE